MKNKLQRIKECFMVKDERGSSVIDFLWKAIIVAILLYVLVVVIKTLFFNS